MPRPTTDTYLSYIYTYIIIFNDGQLKYIMSVLFSPPVIRTYALMIPATLSACGSAYVRVN